jgi:mono/diheme cytochrome c family protein
MNARSLSLLALLTGGLLLGCENKRAPDQWPVARDRLGEPAASGADGAALTYRRYCVGCHGDDGRGNAGTTGADFTAADSPLSKSDDVLLTSVRDGKLGKRATMPPHKPVLKDAQILDVIAYVRERFGGGSK